MKDKDGFNFKSINKYYVEQRDKELKRLDLKRTELLKQLETEKVSLEENRKSLEQVNAESLQLKMELENLRNLLINRGLILDIENHGYDIKEWDNLNLVKRKGLYAVTTKKDEELYTLDRPTSEILADIFNSGYSYSVIVVRVGVRHIKLQLRFVKQEV